MKKTLCMFFALLVISFGYSQKPDVPIEDLAAKMTEHPRPVLIELYINWCNICKIQNEIINKNGIAKQLLYEKFYFSQFDAEHRTPVTFNTKSYKFITRGTCGIHELALDLGGEEIAYPCWVLLSPDYKILGRYNGLLKADALLEILQRVQ